MALRQSDLNQTAARAPYASRAVQLRDSILRCAWLKADQPGRGGARPAQIEGAQASMSAPRPTASVQGSVIICSRNRPGFLVDAVDSILRGEDVPAEIVIADQSDSPHPSLADREPSRDCQIRYIWTNTIGAARARNVGAAHARGDILAFIDDDERVDTLWYGTVIRALVEAGPSAVVTGRVLAGQAETPGAFVQALVESPQSCVYAGRIGRDVLPTCNLALYRSTFDAVGGLDERLGPGTRFSGGGEDNDYGFRLLELGYRIVYVPEATVYHRAWRDQRAYFPLRWAYGRGQGAFYAKHARVRDPYMLRRMVLDVGFRLLRFPWRVFHRPRLAVGDLFFCLGVLSGAGEWTVRQSLHQIQQARV
jgi:GT2 family glycosyltransferase